MASSGRRFDGSCDSPGDALPLRGCRLELSSSSPRQPVVPGTSVRFRFTPFSRKPPAFFEAVEGGEEGASFDLKHSACNLLDTTRDLKAVAGADAESPKDEQIESTFEKFRWHIIYGLI